jgi:hypothetical protein
MPFPLAGRAQAAIKTVANSTIGGCANAYGWTDYTPGMPDDEILRRLLALNLARLHRSSQPDVRSARTSRAQESPQSSEGRGSAGALRPSIRYFVRVIKMGALHERQMLLNM